ncbi:MAG: L-2-hydroxyglutarate oxidase [Actinomycetota bacterium]|nr:L-2-hydroxyglutarate oxidase [Actinomycetota bacterium]
MRYDVCIVGAGLIGLGVAHAIVERFPGVSVSILDKEPDVAAHQSSHNSGVLHSGLYYLPGSLKARLCIEGGRLVEDLCDEESVPFRRTGKLVIATGADEVARLDELERRGRANGLVGLRRLGPAEIAEFEPEAVGVAALHVPSAGVVDFPGVAGALRRRLEKYGALIGLGLAVDRIQQGGNGISVRAGGEEIRADLFINCAGLHSDRVAALAGVKSKIRIVPFRGEYYSLAPSQTHLVKSLIYPVPDARFPFLGVHFTRGVDDRVEVGPNAVLALGREHYRGARVDWVDLRETISAGAFWRLVGRHWWTGTSELLRSRSRSLYARSARRLVPAVRADHLQPGGAGVRAQALAPNGRLVDDFVIQEVGSMIHVLNAPSPGATASLAIGAHIATLAESHLRG